MNKNICLTRGTRLLKNKEKKVSYREKQYFAEKGKIATMEKKNILKNKIHRITCSDILRSWVIVLFSDRKVFYLFIY